MESAIDSYSLERSNTPVSLAASDRSIMTPATSNPDYAQIRFNSSDGGGYDKVTIEAPYNNQILTGDEYNVMPGEARADNPYVGMPLAFSSNGSVPSSVVFPSSQLLDSPPSPEPL